MNIIVKKFGGTSLKTIENRRECIERINESIKKGYKVIAVVSAIGRKGDPYSTDSLLDLVKTISKREKDLLMSTGEIISSVVFSSELKEQLKINSEALTGAYAGIKTAGEFTDSIIDEIDVEKLKKELIDNDVLVVAGFQGVNQSGETTTLGRGGSDTTAVAIAAAINAIKIEIFTDVDGMKSVDPNYVEKAKTITSINFEDALNLSNNGAKVVHPRAIEIAKRNELEIHIKSYKGYGVGTEIKAETKKDNKIEKIGELYTGVTYRNDCTRFDVEIKETGLITKILTNLKKLEVSLDMINIELDRMNFIVYGNEDRAKTSSMLAGLRVIHSMETKLTKLIVVGEKIAGVPGIMSKIIEPLSNSNIRVKQTSDSHTTICLLIGEKDLKKSMNILHDSLNI